MTWASFRAACIRGRFWMSSTSRRMPTIQEPANSRPVKRSLGDAGAEDEGGGGGHQWLSMRRSPPGWHRRRRAGSGAWVQPEAEQDARHLEGVMHLRDKRNRSALANKYRPLAESLLERPVRHLEERVRVRRDPGLALAVHVEFELHCLRQ